MWPSAGSSPINTPRFSPCSRIRRNCLPLMDDLFPQALELRRDVGLVRLRELPAKLPCDAGYSATPRSAGPKRRGPRGTSHRTRGE